MPRAKKITNISDLLNQAVVAAQELEKLDDQKAQLAEKLSKMIEELGYSLKPNKSEPNKKTVEPEENATPSPAKNKGITLFFNDELLSKARQLLDAGKNIPEVAKILGCSQSAVRYRIKRGDI